jgi:hypothetical protein
MNRATNRESLADVAGCMKVVVGVIAIAFDFKG